MFIIKLLIVLFFKYINSILWKVIQIIILFYCTIYKNIKKIWMGFFFNFLYRNICYINSLKGIRFIFTKIYILIFNMFLKEYTATIFYLTTTNNN